MKATSRLNKETLCFLAASVVLSAALYNHFASEPLFLGVSVPISTEAAPSPLCAGEPSPLDDAAVCLAGDRSTPFRPMQPPVPAKPPVFDVIQTQQQQTFPTPVAVQSGKPKPSAEPPLSKLASDLRFVGTVFVGPNTCALMRPKASSTLFRVKAGDAIPEYGCTVRFIGKQSIHLADSRQQPVVLNDRR